MFEPYKLNISTTAEIEREPRPNEIPVTFKYKGIRYHGVLSKWPVAPVKTWDFLIDNRYRGQLVYSAPRGWRFHSQTGQFEDILDVFVKAVESHNPAETLP